MGKYSVTLWLVLAACASLAALVLPLAWVVVVVVWVVLGTVACLDNINYVSYDILLVFYLLAVFEPFVLKLKLFFGVNEIDFSFWSGLHRLGSFNLIILCGVGGDCVVVVVEGAGYSPRKPPSAMLNSF